MCVPDGMPPPRIPVEVSGEVPPRQALLMAALEPMKAPVLPRLWPLVLQKSDTVVLRLG